MPTDISDRRLVPMVENGAIIPALIRAVDSGEFRIVLIWSVTGLVISLGFFGLSMLSKSAEAFALLD